MTLPTTSWGDETLPAPEEPIVIADLSKVYIANGDYIVIGEGTAYTGDSLSSDSWQNKSLPSAPTYSDKSMGSSSWNMPLLSEN